MSHCSFANVHELGGLAAIENGVAHSPFGRELHLQPGPDSQLPLMESADAWQRLPHFAREWHVAIERTVETATALIGFGTRNALPVVIKVVRAPGDEWHCGEVAAAFKGAGVVQVYEHAPGAALFERLTPGTALTQLVERGDDEGATRVLAGVIAAMAASAPIGKGFATVEEWGRGFDRYLDSGDQQIPQTLVAEARQRYRLLQQSQRAVRLLHGDLQHDNVLFDKQRGWTAIDPKGVVGEVEYEIGAALRNPRTAPEHYSTTVAVERRIKCYEAELRIDTARVVEWSFAQAVLSAIWSVEDDGVVKPSDPALVLARTLQPILH